MGADYSQLVVAYTRLAKNIQAVQTLPVSQPDLDSVTSVVEAANAKVTAVLKQFDATTREKK
jgi:hypothetical protein